MKLSELKINESAQILAISGEGATRQHLLDMGLIPGTVIKTVKFAPLGDPIEFQLHDYNLSLRKDDANYIEVELSNISKKDNTQADIIIEHPGLGESGKFHDKKTEKPLSDDEILSFALVGNPNSGKTTLFNRLTGSNQHVGNFPGVTVDKKDGQIINHKNTLVTDLPGIYSMSPYSDEEKVSRNFILDEKPKGIINIVDATSIERGLYLTMQLLELDIPMVLALNMMDEVENNGGFININALESELGIPVVPISAAKNQGIEELIEHAIHITKYQEKPLNQDYCDVFANGGAVHRCLHSIMSIIEDHTIKADIPLRFSASKAAEQDSLITSRLNLDKNELEAIEHITTQMENERGLDKNAAIADMRYGFIMKVVNNSVKKPHEPKERTKSNNIDKILTGKYTAIPSFVLIMGLIFYLSFVLIGPSLQKILETFIDKAILLLNDYLINQNVSSWLHSLIIDGICKGIGSILSFMPIILILFFFLSILEDSGYMARIAFVMDKPLRKIGLSGRSIVPMLVGFGCTVPAIMSTRTIPSKRDRNMTILLTPFMSCSAKLPIYVFFSGLFFPNYAGLVTIALYLLGIITSIGIAFLYRKVLFKGEAVPFVMELPNYRLPSFKNVSQLLWEKAKDFIIRAFSIIFIATIAIWFLQNFSFKLNLVNDSSESMLAIIANSLVPIFKPLGFGDWRIVVALFTGILAKESVVSTLNVLFNTGTLISILSPVTAISLLVFCLLYVPCIASLAAIKKELGGKWIIAFVFGQCFIAWLMSFIIYNLFLFII